MPNPDCGEFNLSPPIKSILKSWPLTDLEFLGFSFCVGLRSVCLLYAFKQVWEGAGGSVFIDSQVKKYIVNCALIVLVCVR